MEALHNLPILVLPFLACLVLVGIHGYLGIHVLARKVIFVDLAMAQIAALGGTVAFLLGHDLRSPTAYFVSLGFTLAGAAVFAITRTRQEKVPQEAIIGLVYAIATAAAIVLTDAAQKGDEHLKTLLSGSIVWVTKGQLLKTAGIYAAVGTFHFVFRRQFLAISFDIEKARAEGLYVRLWDFFFYLSFGFVITSSVAIAGVLLVFCFLIAPAVVATMFFESIRARLAAAWVLGTLVSAVGILFSFDRPSGPTIICFFAAVLLLAGIGRGIYAAQNRLRAAALAAAGCLLVPAIGWGLVHFLKQEGEHDRELHEALSHRHGDAPEDLMLDLADKLAARRSEAAHKLGDQKYRPAVPQLVALLRDRDAGVQESAAEALGTIGAAEAIPELKLLAGRDHEDEWVPLKASVALAELGEVAGLERLFSIAHDAEAHVARVGALNALKRALPDAGAPPGDDEGLDVLSAWWKSKGRSATFDRETRTWRENR